MKKHTLFVRLACGITAAALVFGAIGVTSYYNTDVPGIVEAEKKADEATTDAEDAKLLEDTVTSAVNAADASVSKEETVYVFADADGSVNETVVSAWLKNTDNENLLEDTTNLSDIENVKGDEEYTQSGNTVTWDADGNDIYYQGTSDEEAPVGVKITYLLDGKEMDADEIAGKSGKLTIRFDYENTATVDGTTVPFTMITGVLLPTDTFKNVEISNGQVVSEGNNQVAVGYAFPGLADAINLAGIESDVNDLTKESKSIDIPDSLEITADVTDFELSMTMTVGLPDVLSEVIDTDESGLDDLKDSLDDLNDGVGTLEDGTKAIYDGAAALNVGTNTLASGASALASGTAELASNSATLNNGMAQLADGLNQLQTNSASVDTFADGAKSVADGTLTYIATIDGVKTQMTQIAGGINSKLTNDQNTAVTMIKTALTQGANVNTSDVENYIPTESDTKESVANKVQGAVTKFITAYVNAGNDDDKKKAVLTAMSGYLTAVGQLQELGNVKTAMAPLSSLQASLGATVDNNGNGIDDIQELQAGAQAISDNASAIKNYTAGVNAAATGAAQLQSGLSAYTAGVAKVNDGAAQLNGGVGQLSTGAGQLSTGAKTLNDGVSELADSVDTSKLSGSLTRIEDVLTAGKNYNTFSGLSEGESGRVKFIIKTDGISADD